MTKQQAAWLRDRGVHVVTINKQHPARAKNWLTPDESRTRDELRRFEQRNNPVAEVTKHARRR